MKPKILLIEDDKKIRDIVTELLEIEGFQVSAFESGDGIKGKLEIPEFDLIICDIMLPGRSGYELLKEYKNIFSAKLPPFIFLTAKGERNDLRQGMELGADDYITKPFTRTEILKSINTQLEKRREILKSSKTDNKTKSSALGEAGRMDYEASIFIDKGATPTLLKLSDIIFIRSQRDYSDIITADGKTYTIKKSMKKWESMLPANKFLRIHRSSIINIDYVQKIDKWFNYTYKLAMKGIDEPLYVSQRLSVKLRKQLRSK